MAVIRLFIFIAVLGLFNMPQVAFGQNEGSFRLTLCNKTIKDGAIKDILIIDSVAKDTFSAYVLLQDSFVNLSHANTYFVLLVGKKKWDYLVKLDYFNSYSYSIDKVKICFDYKVRYSKKVRVTDFEASSGYWKRLGFTEHICKKRRKCFSAQLFGMFRRASRIRK